LNHIGGTSSGVMKQVGRTLKDLNKTCDSKRKIIGIASLEKIINGSAFVDDQKKIEV
jgi:hypothetical protein